MWPFKKKIAKREILKSMYDLTPEDGKELIELFYLPEDAKFTHFDLDNDSEHDSVCGIYNRDKTKISIPLHDPEIIKWLYKHEFQIIFLLHQNIRNFLLVKKQI